MYLAHLLHYPHHLMTRSLKIHQSLLNASIIHRSLSDTTTTALSPTQQQNSWLDRLLDRYSPQREIQRIRLGEQLFRAAQEQANQSYVYKINLYTICVCVCVFFKKKSNPSFCMEKDDYVYKSIYTMIGHGK